MKFNSVTYFAILAHVALAAPTPQTPCDEMGRPIIASSLAPRPIVIDSAPSQAQFEKRQAPTMTPDCDEAVQQNQKNNQLQAQEQQPIVINARLRRRQLQVPCDEMGRPIASLAPTDPVVPQVQFEKRQAPPMTPDCDEAMKKSSLTVVTINTDGTSTTQNIPDSTTSSQSNPQPQTQSKVQTSGVSNLGQGGSPNAAKQDATNQRTK